MRKMDETQTLETHMLIIHVDAKSQEAALKAVKGRTKLASLTWLGYRFVDIETLEGYCNACEDRCTVRNCSQRE